MAEFTSGGRWEQGRNMSSIQLDTPMCTVQEFSRRTGIPVKTIRNKIFRGEIPTIKTNLVETKAGAVYVNLLALATFCQDGRRV